MTTDNHIDILKAKTTEERIADYDKFFHEKIFQDIKPKLIESGFFDKPAALKHHGNFPGGLYEHSKSVAYYLIIFTEFNDLEWDRCESAKIIGLLHDMCKTDDYVKSGDSYEWNKNQKFFGHGKKSVSLIQEFLSLTDQEKLCIEFHMGAFVDKSEWSAYSTSVKKCNNVLWTHLADMYASKIDGI